MSVASKMRQRVAGLASRRGSKEAHAQETEALLAEIDAPGADGSPRDAGETLNLRHRAGLKLLEHEGAPPSYAEPDFDSLPADNGVPEVDAAEVTPGIVRAAMLRNGCLLIRGLIPESEATRLVNEIDTAYDARDAFIAGNAGDGEYFAEFEPDPRFDLSWERKIVLGSSGLWGADSPRVMVDVLETFERAGLRDLATDYLGERSAISVNKCLLRRVGPDIFGDAEERTGKKPSAWHQDGAFLGDVQALNVWLALTRCGDVAPGMDVIPKRVDHIVPTGTEGATNDWSVSHAVAEETAGETGIHRPIFNAGDVLLFDELFLHSTAAEPTMPDTRYAVESWFFGPSAFPANYAPLAF